MRPPPPAVIDRIVHHATVMTTNGDSLPPQGRPTEPDGPRSTEENALMGTRRDVASRSAPLRPATSRRPPYRGVPFHVAKRSLFSLPFPRLALLPRHRWNANKCLQYVQALRLDY